MVADNIIFNCFLVKQSDEKYTKYRKPEFVPTKKTWLEAVKTEAIPATTEIMRAMIEEGTR